MANFHFSVNNYLVRKIYNGKKQSWAIGVCRIDTRHA